MCGGAGCIVQLYYTSVVCSIHCCSFTLCGSWCCAVAACKSLAATLAETTVITVIYYSVTTTSLPAWVGTAYYYLTYSHLSLTLFSLGKIGSLACKIGQSWSSCCAKTWLCSSGCSEGLQIRGATFQVFRLTSANLGHIRLDIPGMM